MNLIEKRRSRQRKKKGNRRIRVKRNVYGCFVGNGIPPPPPLQNLLPLSLYLSLSSLCSSGERGERGEKGGGANYIEDRMDVGFLHCIFYMVNCLGELQGIKNIGMKL
jgi:hypothetical protein